MCHWIPHRGTSCPVLHPDWDIGGPRGPMGQWPHGGPKSAKNAPHQVHGVWWLLCGFLRFYMPKNGPQGPFCRKSDRKTHWIGVFTAILGFPPWNPRCTCLEPGWPQFWKLEGWICRTWCWVIKNFRRPKMFLLISRTFLFSENFWQFLTQLKIFSPQVFHFWG